MSLLDEIQARLNNFAPTLLELQDESDLHKGHAGNLGGGHFRLKIVSSQFSKQSQIVRHRMVYQALNDLIPHKIHAISIIAISPDDPITKKSS